MMLTMNYLFPITNILPHISFMIEAGAYDPWLKYMRCLSCWVTVSHFFGLFLDSWWPDGCWTSVHTLLSPVFMKAANKGLWNKQTTKQKHFGYLLKMYIDDNIVLVFA